VHVKKKTSPHLHHGRGKRAVTSTAEEVNVLALKWIPYDRKEGTRADRRPFREREEAHLQKREEIILSFLLRCNTS